MTAAEERAAICKWLRARAAAGWAVDLHVAAGMIEAGNHLTKEGKGNDQ